MLCPSVHWRSCDVNIIYLRSRKVTCLVATGSEGRRFSSRGRFERGVRSLIPAGSCDNPVRAEYRRKRPFDTLRQTSPPPFVLWGDRAADWLCVLIYNLLLLNKLTSNFSIYILILCTEVRYFFIQFYRYYVFFWSQFVVVTSLTTNQTILH